MPLPVGLQTVTVNIGPLLLASGSTVGGTVSFTPEWPLVHEPSGAQVVAAPVPVTINKGTGTGSVVLPASDAAGLVRSGVRYKVSTRFSDGIPSPADFWILLPAASPAGSVDLDLLAPVTGPDGSIVSLPVVTSVAGQSGAVTATQLLAALDGPYALTVQSGTYAGGADDVQLPTTRTLNVAGPPGSLVPYSVLGFQNNDPAAPDSATRLYVVPRRNTHVTDGVGGALKVFGDDYFATDGTAANYRDFGLYFHANQNADTGHQGQGVFWLNSKVNGTPYTGKNPDIGFSFQDGATVAGRFAYLAAGQAALVVGAGKPGISAAVPTAVRLEVQGDIGFDGTGAARGIRWYRGVGLADNLLRFNNNDITALFAGSQRLKLTSLGSLVVGNGSTQLGQASTDGFLYLPSMGGTPSGTPTAQSGSVAGVVDTGNSRLWFYFGGAWKYVTLT